MRDRLRTMSAVGFMVVPLLLIAAFILLWVFLRASEYDTPPAGVPAALNQAASERYEAAITRGLGYLDRADEQISPLQWLIIDYLQRKFALDSGFSAVNRGIKPPADPEGALDFRMHRRIIDPDDLVDSLPLANVSPLRQMTMAAAHCDHIPLPPDFERILEQNLKAGGYQLTHVAFALELMEDNGCALPGGQEQKLRRSAAAGMARLPDQPDISDDLRYEAVAFLLQMERRDLVDAKWMENIASAQRTDGGWTVLPQDTTSNDHPTVLALWALLEYTRPHTPEEAIIRRPTESAR